MLFKHISYRLAIQFQDDFVCCLLSSKTSYLHCFEYERFFFSVCEVWCCLVLFVNERDINSERASNHSISNKKQANSRRYQEKNVWVKSVKLIQVCIFYAKVCIYTSKKWTNDFESNIDLETHFIVNQRERDTYRASSMLLFDSIEVAHVLCLHRKLIYLFRWYLHAFLAFIAF
jgi:hypothetical protein